MYEAYLCSVMNFYHVNHSNYSKDEEIVISTPATSPMALPPQQKVTGILQPP